jgi:hypothetical protein
MEGSWIKGILTPEYFSSEEIQKMKEYKYVGDDNGFTSKHFFQPTAEAVLKWTPMWMAYLPSLNNRVDRTSYNAVSGFRSR